MMGTDSQERVNMESQEERLSDRGLPKAAGYMFAK